MAATNNHIASRRSIHNTVSNSSKSRIWLYSVHHPRSPPGLYIQRQRKSPHDLAMQITLDRFFSNKLCCYLFLRSVSFNVIM